MGTQGACAFPQSAGERSRGPFPSKTPLNQPPGSGPAVSPGTARPWGRRTHREPLAKATAPGAERPGVLRPQTGDIYIQVPSAPPHVTPPTRISSIFPFWETAQRSSEVPEEKLPPVCLRPPPSRLSSDPSHPETFHLSAVQRDQAPAPRRLALLPPPLPLQPRETPEGSGSGSATKAACES